MIRKKILILLLLLASSVLLATTGGISTRNYTKVQVEKDLKSQDMSKYKDNFEELDTNALIQKDVITSSSDLNNNIVINSAQDFANHLDCTTHINQAKWTASIYDANPKAGTLTCLLAPSGNIYNPVGTFTIKYPNATKYFAQDIEAAKIQKQDQISLAKDQFNNIYQTIQQLNDNLSQQSQGSQDYLTVPQVLTNIVLTNTNVVDVPATKASGTLQFQQGINISPKSKIILPGAESLFSTYVGLGDTSMKYFVALIGFFILYGFFHKFSPALLSLISKKEAQHSDTRFGNWSIGLIVAALLFIPYTIFTGNSSSNLQQSSTSQNGKILADYDIMNTNWMNGERAGYSLFSAWANDASKIVIDSEMQSMINKSGIGTAKQIASIYASIVQYQKILDFENRVKSIYDNGYKTNEMYRQAKNTLYIYSDNSMTVFPTKENYGYAMALNHGSEKYYYRFLPKPNFYAASTAQAFSNIIDKSNSEIIGDYYYPYMSLAFCGKNEFKIKFYKERLKTFKQILKKLEATNSTDNLKLVAIKSLVQFQYNLFNNWGYLAVLGLPITKMETAMIGGIYDNPNNRLLAKMDQIIEKNDTSNEIMHNITEAIPFMFIPGVNDIYKLVKNNVSQIGTIFSKVPLIGGLFQAAGNVAGASAGLGVGYLSAKILLGVLPIIGIIILGLLRFFLIILKIFSLHFAALFVLPIAFAKENLHSIGDFTLKLFATMIELPLFVLAVYLAIVTNDLIHSVGNYFSKEIIIGMLDNAEHSTNILTNSGLGQIFSSYSSKLLVYMFDGFMQVSIALISIALVYKIIISFHNAILEILKIKGLERFDDAVDSIRGEAGNLGSKV